MLPLAQLPEPLPEVRSAASRSGDRIVIAGQRLSGGWQWQGQRDDLPEELWLPLDLLEGQLGFSRLESGNLEWYGEQRPLESIPQRPLGDEVALEVADWLAAVGVAGGCRSGWRVAGGLGRSRLVSALWGGSSRRRASLD